MPELKKILEEHVKEIIDTLSQKEIISLFTAKVASGKLKSDIYKSFVPENVIPKVIHGGYVNVKNELKNKKIYEYADSIKELLKNNVGIFEIDEMHPIEIINTIVRKWLLGKINHKYLGTIDLVNTLFWNRILGNLPNDKHKDVDYTSCEQYIKPVLQFLNVNRMVIGHTPQFTIQSGINSSCSGSLYKVDIGGSKIFNMFDSNYAKTGKTMQQRIPQVLEITNDNNVNILYDSVSKE